MSSYCNNYDPRGVQGIQGPQGVQGIRGPPGQQGVRGLRGEQGHVGEMGPRGPRGLEGEQGIQGEQGPEGLNGQSGDKGPNGDKGPVGDNGSHGDKGPVGDKGPDGTSDSGFSVHTELDIKTPVVCVNLLNGSRLALGGLPVTPASISASSVTGSWAPDNVLSSNGVWWMSLVDTGVPEWIEFTFPSPVLLTGVYALCGLGRNGAGNKIQGSKDKQAWVDIHVFDANKWVYTGVQMYKNAIEFGNTYMYIRLYSEPSPYCLYDNIEFHGIV